jgi:hypothetical protein
MTNNQTNQTTPIVNFCNERMDHTFYCTAILQGQQNCSFYQPIPPDVESKLSEHNRTAHPCRFEYDESRWHHDLSSHCRSKEAVTHCKEAIQKDNHLIELLSSSSPNLLKRIKSFFIREHEYVL